MSKILKMVFGFIGTFS